MLKLLQYWIDDAIVKSYGLVRTWHTWNCLKILIWSGQMIDLYIWDITHVILFTFQYTVLTLQYSLQYSVADWSWLPYVGLHLVGLHLVGLQLTIIFDHALLNKHLDNTVFYRKWLNLNTTECVPFFFFFFFARILYMVLSTVHLHVSLLIIFDL